MSNLEMKEKPTNCFCKEIVSPPIGPKLSNSAFLRMTHSINSCRDSNKAFQCSALLSKRFLQQVIIYLMKIFLKFLFQIT